MNLDQYFWNNRYLTNEIGWDLTQVSPPIRKFIDGLTHFDLRILIPGAGNAHEAEYFFTKGFTQVVVVDLSQKAVDNFLKRVPNFPKKQARVGDFFELKGQFDLVLEQTFFCALNPALRAAYVKKCAELLAPDGTLTGLLFDAPLNSDHPPFGGSKKEYLDVFSSTFNCEEISLCQDSHPSRAGRELWINLTKKTH